MDLYYSGFHNDWDASNSLISREIKLLTGNCQDSDG